METDTRYPKSGTQKGAVTGTYEMWEHQQVNQPSIAGTSTFNQYISIRQTLRSAGTVTVANHFIAWAAAGMSLGTLNYQIVAVESWSGSGNGQISVSKGTGTGTTTPSQTSQPAQPTATTPATGGETVAHYGQCGGAEWTGATTCASGYTCKAANSYYSQCL